MWYDEAVVYQIYPLGLCGAPLQNDGDQAQAGEHRILRVLDWVEHIKRLGATCVLFNPLSIVRTLRRYRDGRPVAKEELQHADGRWFHYDFHGSLAGDTADEALTRIDAAVAEGARALHEASAVLLTLGTAWVYERTDTGDVVANCHRQPAERFRRRRLSVEEVVSAIESVLPDESSGKRILLTVSPVRHLGDGLAGNAVSKAVLRLAAEELSERHAQVAYFLSLIHI